MRHQELQEYLSRCVRRRVAVELVDDRTRPVRARPDRDGGLGVTLHGMFLEAPAGVLTALVRFLRRPDAQARRALLRLYRVSGLDRAGRPGRRIRSGRTTRRAPRVTLRHRGDVFDLKVAYDRLNERYFDGRVRALITWGRRSGVAARRSIHFGSYNWERRMIRVNPALDREFVPRFFLEYVIFHEMLHADLGVKTDKRGRRVAHTPEFRSKEQSFAHYARARQWERRNLQRFLAPTG